MNNYLYNIPNDWYNLNNNKLESYNDFNNTFMNNDSMLVNPKEGLEKGNLFSNIYDPYNGYSYGKIKANSSREELLYNILMYKFALNDLNLYLDVYPNNIEIINLFKKYLSEEKKLCNEYESKYGPLTLDSNYIGDSYFSWIKSPWPWEGVK